MTDRRLQRVLLVDDDPDIRRVGEIALSRVGGLEVEVCDSGARALEQAPRFGPDLILLDVMMPEMDGPAVLEALSRLPELEDVPVVFITAKAQKSEIDRYGELGAIGVVKKPFEPMHLAGELRALWAQAVDRSDDARSVDDADEAGDAFEAAYRQRLEGHLEIMDALLARLAGETDRACLREMRELAHRLAGTGAIYGLPAVSELCAEFEEMALDLLVDEHLPCGEDDLCRLRALCVRLRERLAADGPPRPTPQPPPA